MDEIISSKPLQRFSHFTMIIVSLACVLPFILLIASSFTAEDYLIADGYRFIPGEFSIEAYRYLWQHSSQILRGYGITILVTLVGTTASMFMTSMLAYPLSRRDLPLRNVLTFLVVFTLLFNGGLVPTYLIYVKYLGIKNTIFALLIPRLLMNGFNVLLMRTFFIKNIPPALIEAAQIDGASEFQIYWKIILKLSLPIMATVGLMTAVFYWNDWFNGLIFLNDPSLYSIQVILNEMLMNIRFLANNSLGNYGSSGISQIPGTSIRMAIAVIGVLPILTIYPFFQKYFVKGITIGAVKQ